MAHLTLKDRRQHVVEANGTLEEGGEVGSTIRNRRVGRGGGAV